MYPQTASRHQSKAAQQQQSDGSLWLSRCPSASTAYPDPARQPHAKRRAGQPCRSDVPTALHYSCLVAVRPVHRATAIMFTYTIITPHATITNSSQTPPAAYTTLLYSPKTPNPPFASKLHTQSTQHTHAVHVHDEAFSLRCPKPSLNAGKQTEVERPLQSPQLGQSKCCVASLISVTGVATKKAKPRLRGRRIELKSAASSLTRTYVARSSHSNTIQYSTYIQS